MEQSAEGKSPIDNVFREFRKLTEAAPRERIIGKLVLLNLLVTYIRPQNEVPLVGTLRFPVILSTVVFFLWIFRFNRNWTRQTKIFLFFLIAEALRILVGKLIWEDLVRNDNWAYHSWKLLYFIFSGISFPILAFLVSSSGFKSIFRTLLFISLYLGIYGITHSGRGPGGFLGDENDLGIALLTFLPLTMVMLLEAKKPPFNRFYLLIVAIFSVGGILACASRGAFVGLVCLLAFLFWRSKQKVLLVLVGLIIFLATIPFIPQNYIDEIRSISDTTGGTAKERRHFWKIASRVWLDPPHLLFGVGMGNTTYYLGDYERPEDIYDHPSIRGRAVHSLIFEILPDLGIWGMVIIGTLFLISWRGNSQSSLETEAMLKRLFELRTSSFKKSKLLDKSDKPNPQLMNVIREVDFVRPIFIGLNISFVSFLSAGAFLSVLYYPHLWVLITLSAAAQLYWSRLKVVIEQFLETESKLSEVV